MVMVAQKHILCKVKRGSDVVVGEVEGAEVLSLERWLSAGPVIRCRPVSGLTVSSESFDVPLETYVRYPSLPAPTSTSTLLHISHPHIS